MTDDGLDDRWPEVSAMIELLSQSKKFEYIFPDFNHKELSPDDEYV